MVPPYSPGTCPPKTLKTHWSLVTHSLRKKWFSEDTQFCQKYSNTPGVTLNCNMPKLIKKVLGYVIKCLAVQIWQINSIWKCPKLPKRDSEDTQFCKSTQTALESPKIDICQNWPKRVLGDVIRCLVSKFDKINSNGRCPKLPKRDSEDTQFCQKYSNSPGVAKNWHMSKFTKKDPRRCHKVSCVQIWQINSNGKCPKLPKRDSHL